MSSTPPEDLGEPDAELAAALLSGDPGTIRQRLLRARVLVPVVPAEADTGDVEMAVPRLVGVDGRHALPAFTSYDALRAWQPKARPVPMSGEQAIAAALAEQYDAVVLDVAGPVMHVIELEPVV